MSKKNGLNVFTFREVALIIERDGLQRELNRSRKQHGRELKKAKREHDLAKAAHKQRVSLTHRLQKTIDYLERKLQLVELRNPGVLSCIDDMMRDERLEAKADECRVKAEARYTRSLRRSGKPCGQRAASSLSTDSPYGV